jgi:penicillin-binding protein 1C
MRKFRQWIDRTVWQRLNRKTKRICKVLFALFLVGLTVRSLPYLAPIRAGDIAQNRQAVELLDRHGLPLGTLLSRDRQHTAVVPLDRVSAHFIQAILAAEDKRFYQHGALDLQAIGRSIVDSIQQRKVVSGASTITMQLARMLEPLPRNFNGKVKEIWLSWRLTAGMNKDEILAAYINRLPMGGNIYGLEAASRIYFSIPAADLNLAQASILAGLPNNPTYFNPFTHWERLKQRQRYVLDRMVADKYITSPQGDRSYIEQIAFQPRQQGIIAAPHFLFWVSDRLAEERGREGERERGGERGREGERERERELLTPNSFTVATTIDRPLQQFVEAQVQQLVRSLAANNVRHAAALVIDNRTGEVLAYVGSPDYFDEGNLGSNDGVQALRQPGSTLKPLLYELALEKGVIRPNTILADVPTHYAIPGAKLYSPTDYNEKFSGPVRVRIALANSLNVPAVRVLEKVGVPAFLERLRQLGFEHLTQPTEFYGLGLALGSGEVSLWELARTYLAIANQGQPTPLIATLNSRAGFAALKPAPTNSSSSSPPHPLTPSPSPSWQLITDMLSDRHARAISFGVDSVLDLPFPAAVKTGTSSNFRDTWTVGFTTDYTIATWVGNFNGDPMRQVSGVTGAAPLWNRIMLHLHENREPGAFAPPAGMVQKPICALSGLKPTPACTSVVQEYFYPEDLVAYDRQLNDSSQVSNFKSSELQISSPRNGDVFLLPQSGENAAPRLEFKLAQAVTQPVEWWLNGEKLTPQSANSVFWSMKPGNWTLEVKEREKSDRVNFQVQLSNFRPTRRGFSIGRS